MFQHFLLTRMNVVAPFGKAGSSLDPVWLRHRFSLFERYTLPSIEAQEGHQPVRWLLFTHEQTPSEFRERLLGYVSRCPMIELVVCAEFDEHVCKREVLVRLDPAYGHVITSRVDNDDALGRTFLQAVQREFHAQTGEFINFDLGYELHGGRVYHAQHPSNPYCSAIEAAANFRGVFAVSHTQIDTLYPVRHVRDRRRWLTVIHDRNALNRVEGQRCFSRELADEFGWLTGIDFDDRPLHVIGERIRYSVEGSNRRLIEQARGLLRQRR